MKPAIVEELEALGLVWDVDRQVWERPGFGPKAFSLKGYRIWIKGRFLKSTQGVWEESDPPFSSPHSFPEQTEMNLDGSGKVQDITFPKRYFAAPRSTLLERLASIVRSDGFPDSKLRRIRWLLEEEGVL